jgi:hypothetical protein
MKSRIVLSVVFSLLLTGSSSATSNFTGAVDELWSNPNNWTNGVPVDETAKVQSGGLCILDYAAPSVSNINIRVAGSTLRLVNGAALTATSWSAVSYNGGTTDNRCILEVLGGVLDLQGHMRVGRQGAGLMVIDYAGVVNLHDSEFRVGWDPTGDGIVEIRGGSLNLLTGTALPLVFRNSPDTKAHMDFAGGVMTMAYSDERLAFINDHIADGTITAYYDFPAELADYDFDLENAVGTVVVDTGEANDYIHVRGLHPFNPAPVDGSNLENGPVTLEWTVDAGTAVDVWFGATMEDFAKIVDKQAVAAVQIVAEKGTRYFWAVDTYAAGAMEPDLGPLFDFYADNLVPAVDAGADVTTWLDNGSVEVSLSGTVTDADPTVSIWAVVSQPDDPNSADAAIADPTALDTSVTLSAVGEYVLELEADDGEYEGTDTVTINVYMDSCEAAKAQPDYVPLVGDLDGDCDVDQDDLDLLMENWLKCVALGECDPNDPSDPNAL